MGSLPKYFLLQAVALTMACACSQKNSSPAEVNPSADVKQENQAMFEILDQGSEPFFHPRYKLSDMKAQSSQIVMEMSMGAQANGKDVQPPEDLPPVSIVISIEPRPMEKPGYLTYDFKIMETKVSDSQDDDSSMVDGMKGELSRLDGLSGSARISSRGITDQVELRLPGQDDERNELLKRMKEEIVGMSVPLPRVPLGQGAKWKVSMPLKSGTIELKQTTTYHVKMLSASSMKIDVDMEQNAKPQAMDSDNLAGASARLVSLHSDGGGSSDIDFSSLVPKAMAYSHTNVVMELRSHGNQQRVTTTLDLKMNMKPLPLGSGGKKGEAP